MSENDVTRILGAIDRVRDLVGQTREDVVSVRVKLAAHEKSDEERFDSIRTALRGHIAEVEECEEEAAASQRRRVVWRTELAKSVGLAVLGAALALGVKWLSGG